ncbi:MAG: IspD/TarI family cytidylyltransferase [Gleimia sp.]|jgi:2-C-methyl-D-erythritol 4-phosphate cytidylyltransferase|nr:2-C-methyl-D-erythritol 4-phosphate cytidylyltransferase [Acidobacteriota bacterium]
MNPVFAVVTAAGSGTRLGYDMPKALVELAGETLVERAVRGMQVLPEIVGIVVTAPVEVISDFEKIFEGVPEVCVVPGGTVRQLSVYNGLLEIPNLAKRLGYELTDSTPILIHDAARCLTPKRAISDVINVLLDGCKAVIPALPVTDTQKIVDSKSATSSGIEIEKVSGQVDRAQLRAVQTPQGFHWATILEAHEIGAKRLRESGVDATDDGALVEQLGGDVYLTLGSEMSLKITTKLDMIIASELLKRDDLRAEQ